MTGGLRPSADPVRLDPRTPLILLLAFTIVGFALLLPSAGPSRRGTRLIEVIDGGAVVLVLAPGTAEVRVLAVGRVPHAVAPEAADLVPMALHAAWRDLGGAVLAESTSRWSAPPSVVGQDWTTTLLESRSLVLQVPEGARTVTWSVPAGGAEVMLRAWGTPDSARDPALALMRVDARDAAMLPHRLGVERLDELTPGELGALLSRRWDPLRPVVRPGAAVVERVTPLSGGGPTLAVRRGAGLTLDPGRAAAWTVMAPADLVLAGDGPMGALRIAAITEELGEVPVRAAPVTLSWTDQEALRVQVAAVGATSVVVGNPTGITTDRLRLLAFDERALPPEIEAVPVHLLEEGAPEAWSLVAPRDEEPHAAALLEEPLRFDLPGGSGGLVLRLTLRAAGDLPNDTVGLAIRYADGRIAAHAITVDAPRSAFEATRPADAPVPMTPAGEPVSRYLTVGPGAVSLTVAVASGPVLVDLALPGMPRGWRPASDTSRRTRVRYQSDTLGGWTPLPADTALTGPTRWTLRTAARREPMDGEAWSIWDGGAATSGAGGEPAARHYRPVPPAPDRGGLPGETWLVRSGDGSAAAGLTWCPVDAGSTGQVLWSPVVAEALGGVLAVRVWASSTDGPPEAGAAWQISLDGHVRAGEALATTVGAWSGRVSPFRAVRLDAPAGARAWLRTLAQGEGCEGGRQDRRAVPVRAGEEARWVVQAPGRDHWLSLGGLAEGDRPVMVSLRALAAPPVDRVLEAWTDRDREVRLLQVPGDGVALDLPWVSSGLLGSQAIVLRADLAGPVEVRVRAAAPVRLWLSEASDAPRPATRATARVPG